MGDDMKKEWEVKKLGEVLKIERGGSPRPIQKYLTDSEDGINWIKISDATASEKYIYETKQKIIKEGISSSRMVNKGDFLLSNSMSFGRPYIMGTNGCIHDGWLVLREEKEKVFVTEFLYYLLSSPYVFKQFDSLAAGSTVRNLNISLVSCVKVPIPPITEQLRIISILDKAFEAIDKAKQNAEQNLNNTKELFESYLQGVFEERGEGWEEKKLGEITNIIGGGTPSKRNSDYYVGDILWASVRDLKQDLLKDTEFKITEDAVKNSSTNIIPKGNVVIATRVGLGKVCILENDTAINQDLRGIIPKNTRRINSEFLFYWFKSISKLIIQAGTGATVQGVKLPFVKGLLMPFPNIDKQRQIVKRIDIIKSKVQSLEAIYQQKLDDLEELKKSILEKAFSGEL